MKRSTIIFVVVSMVIMTALLWLLSAQGQVNTLDLVHAGVILLLVVFAVFLGISRVRNTRRGEPQEDELSRKLLQRAASLSYYISLYIWVALLIVKDRVVIDTEQLIGSGILGMGLAFAITWAILNSRGLQHE